MGDNSTNSNSRRQFHRNSGLLILSNPIHNGNAPVQKTKKRMEKALMILYNYVFPSGYGVLVFLNINNLKGVVLTFLAVLYALARIVFYVIRQDHERRMRNLDYEERKRKLNEE